MHVPPPQPEGTSRSLRSKLSTMWAYAGPGLLISVGYMDPGNWSTDIFGGAAFGYDLLFVVLVSCLAAMLLQALSLRLGVATGRNLAQLCRERYPPWVSRALWLLAEGAIAACDLAEVLGTAIALKLLLGIPLPWGVVITAFDVLLLLALTGRSARVLEALIAVLLAIVGACFIWTLAETSPPALPVMSGFVPKARIFTNSAELYAAAGILGATVMPHNLYLHSALVQSRDFRKDARGRREAARYGLIDSTFALIYAGFVNAAILVTAAAAFSEADANTVSSLPDAARLLAPALGSAAATKTFGVGLLSSGQQSTITGTLAGQIVMEGFLGGHGLKPWARRLLTRLLALVPAVVVAASTGDSGVAALLNASQVALSIQLPFAIFPLVQFTGRREMMGDMANGRVLATVSWLIFLAITAINAKLIVDFARGGQ